MSTRRVLAAAAALSLAAACSPGAGPSPSGPSGSDSGLGGNSIDTGDGANDRAATGSAGNSGSGGGALGNGSASSSSGAGSSGGASLDSGTSPGDADSADRRGLGDASPDGGTSLGDGGAEGSASSDSASADAGPTCAPGTHPDGGTQNCASSATGPVGNTGYSYNLYSSGQGTGCLTTYGLDATFHATWSNVGDWIGRVGLSFDETKTFAQIGTLSSDFSFTTTGITTGGFGNVGIYGWSVNPLHEYYIEEDWLGKRPDFTPVATFTIDGEGTYDVMTNTQTDQPNITGTNATFVQYWSVRQTPRQCGHISISKHFAEWASLGLDLGNLEEARFLVEAQNNSGTLDLTTGTVVVSQ